MSHKTWAMSDMTAVVLVIRAAMTGITRMVRDRSALMTMVRALMSGIAVMMWNSCALMRDISPLMLDIRAMMFRLIEMLWGMKSELSDATDAFRTDAKRLTRSWAGLRHMGGDTTGVKGWLSDMTESVRQTGDRRTGSESGTTRTVRRSTRSANRFFFELAHGWMEATVDFRRVSIMAISPKSPVAARFCRPACDDRNAAQTEGRFHFEELVHVDALAERVSGVQTYFDEYAVEERRHPVQASAENGGDTAVHGRASVLKTLIGERRGRELVAELVGEDAGTFCFAGGRRLVPKPRVLRHRFGDGIVEALVQRLKFFGGDWGLGLVGEFGNGLANVAVVENHLRHRVAAARESGAALRGTSIRRRGRLGCWIPEHLGELVQEERDTALDLLFGRTESRALCDLCSRARDDFRAVGHDEAEEHVGQLTCAPADLGAMRRPRGGGAPFPFGCVMGSRRRRRSTPHDLLNLIARMGHS